MPVEALALEKLLVTALQIARCKIIHHCVSEDVTHGLFSRNVFAGPADNDDEFCLKINGGGDGCIVGNIAIRSIDRMS